MFSIGLKNHQPRQEGFTLLELAIVIAISGTLMIFLSQFVRIYSESVKHQTTIENLELSDQALYIYKLAFGYYPCPANPTLSPSDLNYGEEQCRDPAVGGYDKDDCTNIPAGIKCTTNGSRDGDDNGSNDVVMMGAFPFRTIVDALSEDVEIREHNKTDGYMVLLSYAITEHMTKTNSENSFDHPANAATGAISVLDENLNSLMDPEKEAQYVVFSHGSDGVGGYSYQGKRIENCFVPNTTTGVPEEPAAGLYSGSGKIETENCDFNDAIFIRGLLSKGDNNNYYDDTLYYRGRSMGAIWKRSYNSPAGQTYLYNTNLESVGIGTAEPEEKLHIMGDLSAEGSVLSVEYCDPSEGSCLKPEFLAGDLSDGECSDDYQVGYAIGQNKLECKKVEWEIPTIDKTCGPITVDGTPNTSYLSGFSNLGTLYCCTDTGDCENQ